MSMNTIYNNMLKIKIEKNGKKAVEKWSNSYYR